MARRAVKLLSQPQRGIGVFSGLLSLLTLGCSTSGGDDTPDSGQPDGSTGDSAILVGAFQVRSVPPVPATGGTPETPGYTSVIGKVYDGPTPSQIIWEGAAREGDCQLFTPRVPFCDQPCGGSAVCVEDDKCQDFPIAHSAGKVSVEGLHTEQDETAFVMDPIANSYQPPASTKLSYPAFTEGEEVSFEASGDYYSAFTLRAKGVSPLDLLNETIRLEPNQAVQLTWTSPGQAGTAKIRVKLDISHHGGTRGMIECDAEDKGSLELPASLLTQLLDLGAAGFPTIIVTRKAMGSATIAPGRVDLIISSEVERAVQIEGLTSCSGNAECPSGQTCQNDLTCK
jgi:hypothetical protein